MKVITTEKLPIKSWCENPEDGAIEQAKNLANLPFLFKHVALMPDCHQGYGMPIGGVMVTKGVVVINAVGVDIGCGMLATKSSLKKQDIGSSTLKEIMTLIRKNIPVGFNHQPKPFAASIMPSRHEICDDSGDYTYYSDNFICNQEFDSARSQLSTLGGGSHFIEVQYDQDDNVWFMLHSGSRNLGKKIADHYNNVAVELNKKWFSSVPSSHQLAFLPLDLEEGQNYIKEMNYALAFAQLNRNMMAMRIKDAFEAFIPSISFEESINIHHNYAAMENHFGQNVMVHRKGATRAYKDQLGIIPGSQGTSSYIVRGLGNPESFMSCSHGAGRKMGRKDACRRLDLQSEIDSLNSKGIIHAIRSKDDSEEAPGAYKDIQTVMEEQKDLVSIEVELKPLAVIKG